jgi:hypothetical protein
VVVLINTIDTPRLHWPHYQHLLRLRPPAFSARRALRSALPPQRLSTSDSGASVCQASTAGFGIWDDCRPTFGATATFSPRASTKRQCLLTTSPPTTVIARTRQPQQHLDTPYSLPALTTRLLPRTALHCTIGACLGSEPPSNTTARAPGTTTPRRTCRRRDAACSTALPAE